MDDAPFLFACCQPGAEAALKNELALAHAEWRFAFSRPGFVTFKWTGTEPPSSRLQLKSVFARCFGWSLGSLDGSEGALSDDVVAKLAGRKFQQIHVWRRYSAKDPTEITSEETERFGESVRLLMIRGGMLPSWAKINQPATTGQAVVDLMQVAPDQWWLGWHYANSFGQRWPGGVPRLDQPADAVSRAYMKIREAILWSQLPLQVGDRCVDVGSAPGGASQALLDAGLIVMGIDPAEMHSTVLGHKNFTHLRKRAADVRRRQLRGYKWLVVDAIVAPENTLDAVESIVTHPSTTVKGMLLTLKLPDWRLAQDLSSFVQRVRSWGYADVRCRQLAWNHQEVCLAALRSRGLRRRRSREVAVNQADRRR